MKLFASPAACIFFGLSSGFFLPVIGGKMLMQSFTINSWSYNKKISKDYFRHVEIVYLKEREYNNNNNNQREVDFGGFFYFDSS